MPEPVTPQAWATGHYFHRILLLRLPVSFTISLLPALLGKSAVIERFSRQAVGAISTEISAVLHFCHRPRFGFTLAVPRTLQGKSAEIVQSARPAVRAVFDQMYL
jgi:hypothetical protein